MSGPERGKGPAERIEAATFQPLADDRAAPKRRLRPVILIGAAAAALFLLALAFLLTARSVEIAVVADVPAATRWRSAQRVTSPTAAPSRSAAPRPSATRSPSGPCRVA